MDGWLYISTMALWMDGCISVQYNMTQDNHLKQRKVVDIILIHVTLEPLIHSYKIVSLNSVILVQYERAVRNNIRRYTSSEGKMKMTNRDPSPFTCSTERPLHPPSINRWFIPNNYECTTFNRGHVAYCTLVISSVLVMTSLFN